MLVQTETLTGEAFDAVTLMSTLDMFFGDSKTDTGKPQRIQAAEDGDMRRASPRGLLEDKSEMTGS